MVNNWQWKKIIELDLGSKVIEFYHIVSPIKKEYIGISLGIPYRTKTQILKTIFIPVEKFENFRQLINKIQIQEG